jgi:hypothetical protein
MVGAIPYLLLPFAFKYRQTMADPLAGSILRHVSIPECF